VVLAVKGRPWATVVLGRDFFRCASWSFLVSICFCCAAAVVGAAAAGFLVWVAGVLALLMFDMIV
jgi:hypothetical protein